jgi:hypothetical protein
MDNDSIKHSLMMLKDDLDRPSFWYLRKILQDIIDTQKAQMDNHGQYLISTADQDLPRLRMAALLNKSRLEAAQELMVYLNVELLDGYIKAIIENEKREKEENE